MFAFCSCNSIEFNAILGPVETRKLSFRLYIITQRLFILAKTDTELTRTCRQTVAGLLFVFVDHGAGIRRATYLCLDCSENVDKNWNITISYIIHVNFDHVWAEHYPITLIGLGCQSCLLCRVAYMLDFFFCWGKGGGGIYG